jgi:hypothetical protein
MRLLDNKTSRILIKVVPILMLLTLIVQFSLVFAQNNTNSSETNTSVNNTLLNVTIPINNTNITIINQTNETINTDPLINNTQENAAKTDEISESQNAPETIKIGMNIKDSKGDALNAKINIYHKNKTIAKQISKIKSAGFGIQSNAEEEEIEEGTYDIEVIPDNNVIKKIEFDDVKINENKSDFVSIDDVPETIDAPEGKWEEVYAIDPTSVNFTSATVTVTAKGNSLYKCKDWDFSAQSCNGLWSLFKTGLEPGKNYTFTLTPKDPGFGEIILIEDALHLDENKTLISSIYDEVREKDNLWSEPIYENEFVRVTFEQKLDSSRDITLYARNNQSLDTYVEVYLENSTELITSFPTITDEDYYKIYLTGMSGTHDTFDLRIVNTDAETAYLEFDHILDPVAYVLQGAVYTDNTDADFSQGSLTSTNVSGSGAGANVTLNSTTISTFKVYNLSGNFTSRLLDAVVNTSTFSNIAWYSVLPNSTDAMGYANDNGANDLAVFYRNGSFAYAGDPDNFNNDATTITAELLTYTLGSGTYDDIIGAAMDDDASDEADIFLIDGTVLSTADLGNTGLKQALSFSSSSTWSIPAGFNATNILGFVINTGSSQAAVFFKNKSFVTDPNNENPPFAFTDVYSYTVPSGFDMGKVIGVSYDAGGNDLALLLNNNSFISDPTQTDLTTNSDIIDHHVIAYFSDLKLITYSNITLQTRVSNDTVTFSPWSKNYTNPTGTEVIAEPNIARYIQYKARFDTPDKYITPFLENVSINFTDLAKPRINSSVNDSAPKINEIVNITANVSDNAALSFCRFVINQSGGAKQFFNKSITGTDDTCSQNFTISLGRANVINFTVIVNDTSNNLNQSENIITVANTPAPQAAIVFPENDFKTNRQPLDLNATYPAEVDGDTINISFFIDGVLNQTQLELNTTFNASDGTYILNVSLWDGIAGSTFSANATVNFTIDTTPPVINTTLNRSYSDIGGLDVVNITANATDPIGLSFGQILVNISGFVRIFNTSLSGAISAEFSQNITLNISKGEVVNFTARVNDSVGNFKTNGTIITIANTPAPQAAIVFPVDDFKTNKQPLDLNVTFLADPDEDVFNISYYIDGKFNQSSLTNTTFNASDGTYILNVSLFDNVSGAAHSSNVTVNFTIDNTNPIVNSTLNKSYTNITVNDIINLTANTTDNVDLSFGQVIVNISGIKRYFNFSLTGDTSEFSQNITIDVTRGEVINFTTRVNDTASNFRTNDTIITIANTQPSGFSIIQPTNNLFTNSQPLDLNITFTEDPDGDTTNISYYIDGTFNQSSLTNTTFNASDGVYTLNVSITDGIDTHDNITINFTLDTTLPINNATLNKSFTNITVNDVINLTANVTDETGLSFGQIIVNISGIKRYFNFSLNDALTAEFSQNITIGVTRGEVINFTSRVNDTSNNFKTNDTIITIANTPPSGFSVVFPTADLNTSSQPFGLNVTFTEDPDGDTTTINYYIDGKLNDSTTTNTTFNASDSHYLLNVSIADSIDHHDNITINFTIDLAVPTINKIIFSPNTTDDVDPDVLLNFTINATDSTSEIRLVVLQYKQSGAGFFTNSTAEYESSTGLYNTSFTPDIADTWNYRIYVTDHAGNNDSSDITDIAVQNDRTWNRIPGTLNNLACGFSKTCETGNITINNTGDFTLNFDLNSNFGDTLYNVTEPFDLVAKEVKVVNVSLTAGSSAAESNVVITIDATTSNADPDSDTTNFTFTTSAGGPVFDIVIISSPTEANKSNPGVFHLNSSLKNIGNETSGYTYINWTLPAEWLNVSGTNLSKNISNVSVDEVIHHNITINLTANAATGTQKVNVTAVENNTASDSATASIVVTETSTSSTTTTTTTTTTTIVSGGSGGGGGTGGGGGSAPIILKPEKIEISQNVDLVRGQDSTFEIEITNTFNNSIMENLTLQVEGFLTQYLSIEPTRIAFLGYEQTRVFTVTVSAPPYKGYEEHTLKATVTGFVVKTERLGNITTKSTKPYLLKNFISLIVHESSQDQVILSIQEAKDNIELMQASGISVNKALKLLEQAQQNLNNRKYQLAQEITDQIDQIKENAFSSNLLIDELKKKIQNAENRGLQVEETRRLLNLALAAFEREDFVTALQRTKDAELSIVIETQGKVNILKFMIDFWFPLLVALIVLLIGAYFTRKQIALIIIARRLQDLQREETTINDLMQETQTKYYKDKKISTTEYHKSMYGYEKRLSEASQSISRLRSKRVGIIEISNEIKNLQQEDKNSVTLIKQLQDNYYNKKAVPRKIYLKRFEQYKTRRIEIEKSIAIMEAKLAKKERLEELKAKEASKKELLSKIKKKDRKFGKLPPIMPGNRISNIKKAFAFVPKIVNKFNAQKLFRKDSDNAHRPAKTASEKEDHSESVHKLLDDLIKKKEKPLAVQSKENIESKNKLAIKELFGKQNIFGKVKFSNIFKKPNEIGMIKRSFKEIEQSITGEKSIINRIKNINLKGKKYGSNKKELISKLKNSFHLDKIKVKERVKQYTEDVSKLKKHGFQIKEKPEPKYVIPHSHTKNSILKHFKEVYKNVR